MENITNTRINIDLTYLHSVSGGDAGFEKILLTSALTDIQMNIDKMKEAWQQQDAATIGTAAHTMKAVMVVAGLPQLEKYCKKVDVTFRDNLFHAELSDAVFAIINGWTEAKPKLEELISMY
jgi:HPt (histidine-containing phosphotransfer) domain-containing protein